MIKIAKKGPINWYMKRMGFKGWTSAWGDIYLMPGHENDAKLIIHEQEHLAQMTREGKLKFLVKYSWYWLRHGYRNNPYEIEARRKSGDIS